jgi:hypothetical protein
MIFFSDIILFGTFANFYTKIITNLAGFVKVTLWDGNSVRIGKVGYEDLRKEGGYVPFGTSLLYPNDNALCGPV